MGDVRLGKLLEKYLDRIPEGKWFSVTLPPDMIGWEWNDDQLYQVRTSGGPVRIVRGEEFEVTFHDASKEFLEYVKNDWPAIYAKPLGE